MARRGNPLTGRHSFSVYNDPYFVLFNGSGATETRSGKTSINLTF